MMNGLEKDIAPGVDPQEALFSTCLLLFVCVYIYIYIYIYLFIYFSSHHLIYVTFFFRNCKISLYQNIKVK